MGLPGNLPYYMTGPATRPGAMKNYSTRQKAIEAARSKGNQLPLKPKPPKKVKLTPKVVAAAPNLPKVTPTKGFKPPKGPAKPSKPVPIHKPVNTAPVKPGNKPGKPKPSAPTVPAVGGIGFNPQKMAQSLTNLGYDADIAAIQRQIDTNKGNMGEALKDIQGWATQVETTRAQGAADAKAAYDQGIAQSAQNNANIGQLFGGTTAGEAGAYAGAGQDLLSALASSGQAFDARMAPILAAQSQDYARRAQAGFNQQDAELRAQLLGKQGEKSDSYQKNLLDLMDMAWGRKQDIFNNQQQIKQYQLAKQAADQAAAMSGIEVTKGKQDIIQGKQQITANKVALKKSQVELQKLQQQAGAGGFDFNDPQTISSIASAAFQGALAVAADKPGVFMINPKAALSNAQAALSAFGVQGNPQVQNAIWQAFVRSLTLSHQHGRWRQYYLNQNGQLVFDPTRKKKNR